MNGTNPKHVIVTQSRTLYADGVSLSQGKLTLYDADAQGNLHAVFTMALPQTGLYGQFGVYYAPPEAQESVSEVPSEVGQPIGDIPNQGAPVSPEAPSEQPAAPQQTERPAPQKPPTRIEREGQAAVDREMKEISQHIHPEVDKEGRRTGGVTVS